ncbi:MAG: DegV family protein [Oscillospiraceae bacterium]|nr:DegV family protein [Oscillospiraceae bacterium]MBR7010239.1 DegV family protein [Oscillospiraceae bacterium]
MKPYIISADSTLDMPPELLERYDIRVIASYVTMGENTVDDWPDLTQKELLDYVKQSGQLAKTSAANPDDYEKWFRRLRAEGRPVIHVAKSAGVSSCYQNACIAAQEVGNVWVVDSKNLAGGTSLTILAVLRSDLEDPAQAAAFMEAYRERIEGSFIIETLEFLRKGGRCSTLAALGANILKLRPEIVFEDGIMRVGKKYRGVYRKCVYEYLDDQLAKLPDYETDLVYMNHTLQDPAFLKELKDYVKEKTGCRELIEYPASSAISTHCGPNTFGMFFVRKEK